MPKTSEEVAKELAEKTYRELLESPKTSYLSPNSPASKTERESPKGKSYRFSAVYRNSVVLRLLVKKYTDTLDPRKFLRFISQVDAAASSVVANVREGYKRPTTKECLDFYGYAHASLEEVRGFVEDARDDEILASKPGSNLKDLRIELKPIPYHQPLESPKIPYDPLGDLKEVIRDVKREDLTWEIFLELLNKTDYLMKRAVEGLQAKMEKNEDAKKHGAAGVWERKYLS
ncbi:MAG: four helix bundle protein [Patescibacteria group bacterium]